MNTVNSYKAIIKEGWSKNMEALCAAMKLNKIQKDILTDYMNNGQIKAQYVGRAAGSNKETRIYAAKKKYTCLLYTSPSPRDQRGSRMPSSG